MEFITNLFTWLQLHGAEAMAAVLAVLGGFSVLARFTPTQADDKAIQFILDIVHKIGLTK